MTGAMLPGGARAAATDGCRLLAAILAHDLETPRVLPRRKSLRLSSQIDSFLLVGAAARRWTTY